NQIGVRVIWFVRKGKLEIVRSQKSYEVSPNEWCILDSSMPFFAHATPEEHGSFDAIQAIVPAQVFLSHLPGITELNRAFPIAVGGQKTIARYLDLLFGEGERLSRSAAEPLATSFLKVISDSLSNLVAELPRRKRLIDQRFEDIEAYVARNLTDPDLNYIEVAAKCGISARYFCHVLKEHDTSFSELLWSQRLKQARNWLESPEYQDHPIYQIAFMAGFKSAAHFSRMFKEFYGCSPREFRAARSSGSDTTEHMDPAEQDLPAPRQSRSA
ncbi:MAG: helix-turn-helix domain-containing protein, partial [Gammaproteobacteria bacterium]